jgi:hypothetical protein
MNKLSKVSRRSFLVSVTGVSVGSCFITASDANALQPNCSDRDPSPPRGDPGGRGRNCTTTPTPTPTPTPPSAGCSDRDPTDPGGRGRRCTPTTTPPSSGCSDSDPADPIGRGRSCSGVRDGNAHPTGRRERRYEVCWVDHPSRSNAECNVQTYSEWATTYSDGRVVYDTADADRRKAEMTARGYTARWHRMIVNDW